MASPLVFKSPPQARSPRGTSLGVSLTAIAVLLLHCLPISGSDPSHAPALICAAAAREVRTLPPEQGGGLAGKNSAGGDRSAGVPGFEDKEYAILEKGLFGRVSEAVQREVMGWTGRFKTEFGEEAFDALLDRYTRTPEFQEKAIRAYELQSTDGAREAFAEIEILSRLIPETYSRWKRLARDSRRDRRTISRDLAETVKSHREEADTCFSELRTLIEKHNRLVGSYNRRFLGGVEFFSESGESMPEAAGGGW